MLCCRWPSQGSRRIGGFLGGIPLAVPVSEDKITARYQNGVLKVMVPKSEAVRPKRVPVST
jgi:HSP20 family protein